MTRLPKPTRRTRSAHKRTLKAEAHQASVKGTVRPRRRVFIYSTTAGRGYA